MTDKKIGPGKALFMCALAGIVGCADIAIWCDLQKKSENDRINERIERILKIKDSEAERDNSAPETLEYHSIRTDSNSFTRAETSPQEDSHRNNGDKFLKAMKHALKAQESSGRLRALNSSTQASGLYQYLPSTALGLIRQARKEGVKIPYGGLLTEMAVKQALRSNPELNESLADYDLGKKIERFGEDPRLIAMMHYAGESQILRLIRKGVLVEDDFADDNIRKFEKKTGIDIKRAKVKKVNYSYYGGPSIREYAAQVESKYRKYH